MLFVCAGDGNDSSENLYSPKKT